MSDRPPFPHAPEPSPTMGVRRAVQRAHEDARGRSHEYVTVEHLLLALADDEDAAETLEACAVVLDLLRGELRHTLDVDLRDLIVAGNPEPIPTMSFGRTMSRATIHVQSAGRVLVTGANVLVAMFSERETHAVRLLADQGMSRMDAVNFMAHGIRKEGRTLSGDG